MVFVNRFIACVKVDGKVLREDSNGVVNLPFGAEYSVLLKNLNSVRAQVRVSVDGTDATGGTWLIIPANGSVELERYIRDGNFDRGNKFKFIERTAGIEAHKGIGSDDGLIRVEFKSEKVEIVEHRTRIVHHDVHVSRPYYDPYYWPHYPYGPRLGGVIGGQVDTTVTYGTNSSGLTKSSGEQTFSLDSLSDGIGGVATSATITDASANVPSGGLTRLSTRSLRGGPTKGRATFSASASSARETSFMRSAPAPVNEAGITVPGSESNQRFTQGAWFATEANSHVVVLQLRGALAGKKVKKAVTVKTKVKCSTCGKAAKASEKYCAACGTALVLI